MRRALLLGLVAGLALAATPLATAQEASGLQFGFGSQPVVQQQAPSPAVRHDLPGAVAAVGHATDFLPAGPRPGWTEQGLLIEERESAARLTVPWIVNVGATRLDREHVYPMNVGDVRYDLQDERDTLAWMGSTLPVLPGSPVAATSLALPDLQFVLNLHDGSLRGCVGACPAGLESLLARLPDRGAFHRGSATGAGAALPAPLLSYVPAGATAPPAERARPAAPLDAVGSIAATSAGPLGLLPAVDPGTAALVLAAGLLLVLGPAALYSKIRRDSTLENETRRVIYEAVVGTPGLSIQDVARRGNVSHSTAAYHLERLSSAGLVVATGDGNKVRFYRNGGRFTEQERKLLPILENAETVRVLETVMASPWTYRAEIAQKLGVTATTVNWHLKRLFGCAVLTERREGRNAYLFVERASLHVALRGLHDKLQPSPPRDVAARLLAELGPVQLPAPPAPPAPSLASLPPVPPPHAPSPSVTVAGTVYPRLARPAGGPMSLAGQD